MCQPAHFAHKRTFEKMYNLPLDGELWWVVIQQELNWNVAERDKTEAIYQNMVGQLKITICKFQFSMFNESCFSSLCKAIGEDINQNSPNTVRKVLQH